MEDVEENHLDSIAAEVARSRKKMVSNLIHGCAVSLADKLRVAYVWWAIVG